MTSKNYILITLTVLLSVTSFAVASGCRPPEGGVGTCIVIQECTPIVNFVDNVTTLTPALIKILRNYQCGFERQSVKVCCPDGPLKIGVPAPPDVTSHRNINLLPLTENCGYYSLQDRIINGNKTALSEFPWMALLSYRIGTGRGFQCGGTLINNRYILTAAHCITNLGKRSLLGVRLGEYNISSVRDCEKKGMDVVCADPVQDIEIEEMIPHPNYNITTYDNDIGLLRLKSPAHLKANVKPICLPTLENLRNRNFEQAKLIVTGWGQTSSRNPGSEDLLKAVLPFIPEGDCKAVYKQTEFVINHKRLCAGGKNKTDSCGGDSGGPLQAIEEVDDDLRYVQYGIVSFGPRFCGLEGYPAVYTKLNYYMDWILDNMHA